MANAPSVTIFHNPKCGTSRTVLAALRDAGRDPVVVEYLKTGWTKPQLEGLLKAMKASPRDILRAKEPAAAGLAGASDAAILAAMVADPILVERPIVVTPKGTTLCRPAEKVQALL
jgi:arsenate reductase (glutaredoxin)